MCLDWNNQYCQNDYTTWDSLQIQCNPSQNANGIFHRTITKKIILICMETQKTANSQSNPGKEKWSWKNPSSGDFKLKVMLIYYSQSPRTLKNYTKSTLLMLYKWKDKTRMTTYLYPMVYWIFKAHCWYLPLRKKKKILLKILLLI